MSDLHAYWTSGRGARPLGVLMTVPTTCPRCGAEAEFDHCDVTALGEREPRRIAGRMICPTPGCGTTCPICHREPGDIHSGACAPIVLRKLTDPVRVTIEDCQQAVRE